MTRAILALACVLCWAGQAQAQFTLIGQDAENCASVTTCQNGTGIAVQAGDLLVMGVSVRQDIDPTGVSDATNGAWTCPAGLEYRNAATHWVMMCYFINSGAATIQPTTTIASSGTIDQNFSVWRPSGTVTIDTTTEIGTGTPTTSHVGSTLSAGTSAQLAIAAASYNGNNGGCTGTSGMTALSDSAARGCYFYDITSVGSANHDAAHTTGASLIDAIAIVTFNDSGGGGGACTGGVLLLGAGKCE